MYLFHEDEKLEMGFANHEFIQLWRGQVPVGTVIYFQNFGMVRVFEVILLIFDFQAYLWPSYVSRITGKMKKANKGHEG